MLVINHITLNSSHPLDSQYQITFISDHEKKKKQSTILLP